MILNRSLSRLNFAILALTAVGCPTSDISDQRARSDAVAPSPPIVGSATIAARSFAARSDKRQRPGPSLAAQYTLRFSRPETHYADVEAVYSARGRSAVEVMMPVWTPGSYLVREFARHVERLTASSTAGEPRSVEKTAKNRWRVETGGAPVVVRYRVYGRERSVRTNFIDADHAVINPAATFMGDVDSLDEAIRLVVHSPAAWPDVAVALPAAPKSPGRSLSSTPTEGSTHAFVADDFDALIDAPMLLGRLRRNRFSVGGVIHELVTYGGRDVWPYDRAAEDTRRIAEAIVQLFEGHIPYQRYIFLNVLNGHRGGLEHGASTLMMASRWQALSEEGYARWTGLVAHELFHAYSGKRLRPASLGPFDYERENYVRTLWAVEGFTSYYDNLLRVRAGLLTPAAYFELLSHDIEKLAANPGQEVQSLDAASFDTWIKYYRPDENSNNSATSYYTKGSLVAWVLDARIRRATGGRRSLDDVMRQAYKEYSGATGYRREELIAVVEAVAGAEVADWLDEETKTARRLSYEAALEWFGLRFEPMPPEPTGSTGSSRQARRVQRKAAWLGLTAELTDGRWLVQRVRRDGPAFAAGLNVDDELIGLGGDRIIDLDEHIARYMPGTRLPMVIARQGQLKTLSVEIGARPREKWALEIDPNAQAAKTRRHAWLGAPPQ